MADTIEPTPGQRITSIDLLRGAVMVIMALDHTRDFFHYGAFSSEPTDLATTTPALFLTRWITHYCAPVFVFLSGTSAHLFGLRAGSTAALSRFLFTRGLWLVFAELTFIHFCWSFNPTPHLIFLQVIWAIGISMVVLAGLVHLPRTVILGIGAAIVLGHNLLDGIRHEGSDAADIGWYLLHQSNYVDLGGWGLFVGYPMLPWLGVMCLGYALGGLFAPGVEAAVRRRRLVRLGLLATAGFVVLRLANVYGDPAPWAEQRNGVFTLLSLLNTTKYPPSLLYTLMTLGPALLVLAAAERWKGAFAMALVRIGRVPFFYYVMHLLLIHALTFVLLALQGLPMDTLIMTKEKIFGADFAGYGVPLWGVYLIWAAVVGMLYPLCRWYGDHRAAHREKWWLSYL